MKLRIISDLHLDDDPRWPLMHFGEDAILCAGDLGEVKRSDVIEALIASSKVPFYYTPGNHDAFGGTQRDVDAFYRKLESKYPHFHYLVNETADLGKYLLAATPLWTDFALHGPKSINKAMRAAADHIPDFNFYVHVPSETPDDGRARLLPLEPKHLIPWNREARAFLAEAIGRGKPTIVMTHWCPAAATISPEYADNEASAYFTCDCTNLMGGNVVLWVHGHSHTPDDQIIKGTRVIRNPKGYRDKRSGWISHLTIDLP